MNGWGFSPSKGVGRKTQASNSLPVPRRREGEGLRRLPTDGTTRVPSPGRAGKFSMEQKQSQKLAFVSDRHPPKPHVGSDSPWDRVQWTSEIAAGLVIVSTAGHGGLWLSPERWQELKRALPNWGEPGFPNYSALGWLEEDCDICAAVLVWPDQFPIESAAAAMRQAVEPYGKAAGMSVTTQAVRRAAGYGGARPWLTEAGQP